MGLKRPEFWKLLLPIVSAPMTSMRTTWMLRVLFLLLGSSWIPAHAQEWTEADEAPKRIRSAETMATLGPNLFGDSVNNYNGQTTFSVTDIDLPGNNRLPVRVTRTRVAEMTPRPKVLIADWELEVPYLSGVFATSIGWQVTGSQPNNRCSGINLSNFAPPTVGNWTGDEYWRGLSLHVPGGSNQTLLFSTAGPRPNDGQTSRLLTQQFWQVRCLPQLANAGADPLFVGEGFLVLAPDGTKYYFNWMKILTTPPISRQVPPPPNVILAYERLNRVELRMYATRIEDRFGNSVNYAWSGGQLNSITASDGRQITFSYNADGVLATADAHGRIWRYTYPQGGGSLKTVELPDHRTWQYSFPPLKIFYSYFAVDKPPCYRPGKWSPANQDAQATITHPSGAVGTFTFSLVRLGRSRVVNDCNIEPYAYDRSYHGPPIEMDSFALTRKTITGPGLNPAEWQMSYIARPGGFYHPTTPDQTSAFDRTTVTVTNPDQSSTRHTFGIRYYVDEGLLFRTESLSPSGALLRDETYNYALNAVNPPYAFPADPGTTRADDFASNLIPRTQTNTLQRSDITQSFDSYTNTVNGFDNFRREVSVTRSNSLNITRTDVATYYDDTVRWVLGQIKSSTNSNTGLIESAADYDPNTALPVSSYRFGLLQKTATYNANGTLATLANALNQTTSFSNWKRGVPQTILYADNSSSSAVIDDYGLVSSVTDERSNTTAYGYDELGRLASVSYPTGDSQAWSSKAISFTPLATAELGVPAGAWRLRMTEGNHQKSVYLDARYNPIFEEDRDTASGVARYLKRSFDYEGRATFSSYPSNSSSATAGISSVYDPLGRMSSQQTTDGVTLATISYLSSNRRQTTDADGKTTTISYQAFDQPAYESPLQIVAPEGQTTTIARDVFGKMNSVNQSGLFQGSNLSYTRQYRYDAYQRLCGRFDPESGTTGWGYDLASRLVWELKGQTETSCVTDVISPSATRYTYDARGRKTLDDYRNTAYDVSYGYDAAGNLTSVSNPTTSWTYSYNKRNLLETEQAQLDGRTFVLASVCNSIANVTNTIYPDTMNVVYVPDAFGRPTQMSASCCGGTPVGVFVSSIQYHPNGLVSSYSLGNGLSYTQSLDNRLRPSLQETKSGVTAIQRLAYSYSPASDLTAIDDQVDNTDDATLGYDSLHRLTNATGLWGSYTYQYDAINNLRGRTGTNALSYSYDTAKNRLSSVSGSASRTYGYDARGRIATDGSRNYTWNDADQITAIPSVASYVYDGNGKRIKTVKAGNVIEYTLYSRSGTLAYVDRSNNTRSSYLQVDGKTIAEVTNGAPTYLHPDLLGSPRMATGASSSQPPLWSEHYGPYGEKLNGVNAKVGYTGHAYDAESGLTYAQARFYDAAVGRFLSIDPIGFTDNPFSFNRYSYANDNPYRFTDPTGNVVQAIAGCAVKPACAAAVTKTVEVAAKVVIAAGAAIAATPVVEAVANAIGDAITGNNVGGEGVGNEEAGGDGESGSTQSPQNRPEGVPDDYIESPSNKGDGTKYTNPDNPHDNVRDMPGNPKSPNPSQQNPYVKQMRDGKAFDRQGNRVDPNTPEAHIPRDDFRFRP